MTAKKSRPRPASKAGSTRREALRLRLADEAPLLAQAAVSALFACTAGDLLAPAEIGPLVRRLLDSETLEPALFRQARAAAERELGRWRESGEILSDRVPPEIAARLRARAADPDLFRGPWLEKLASNEVLEQVMGATLYEVLREFTATVNPFFSSWGLPALLKKAGPLGRLGLFGLESGGRLLESLREEFERQLEPHIKTFLQKSAKAAVLRAVAHAQSEENLQAFAKLRVRLLDELLRKKLTALAESFDQGRLDHAEAQLKGWFEDLRGALRRVDLEGELAAWLARNGRRTLREHAAAAGLDPEEILKPLAQAVTPALRSLLVSEAIVDRLEAILRDL